MKARCKCGHIFDVTPDLEGKRVRCPRCSKVVRLPTSARPAPPPAEKEEKAGEFEFDWGEEFSLEGEEAPKMGAAPAPEAGEEAGPEKEQPRTPGLEFDSEEFHLDLGEQAQQGQEGEPIELGPGQILGVREGTPGRGPADAAAPAGEARVCSHCGRVVVEEVAACPECGTPLGPPPSWRETRRGRRREREEMPDTIFGLILMCVRRPSLVGDIGAGGISGTSMLAQIAGAFLVLTLGASVLDGIRVGEVGLGEYSIGAAGLGFLLKLMGFLAVVVAMWVLAAALGGNASFLGIVSGLAFVRVMAGLLLLGVAALAGAALLLASLGVLPSGVAYFIIGASGVTLLVFTFMFQLYFVMGVYDLGCWGAVGVNILATLLAGFIQMYLMGVLAKIAGVTLA